MPQVREYLRSRASLLAGGAYLLVAIMCTRVPLFNYLGFESSFATALTGSFVAGFLAIHFLRPAYRESDPATRPFLTTRLSWTVVLVQLVLLMIPLAALTGNALFVPNCDYAEGLAFYVLLPGVTVVFATGLAVFCTVHYRHPRLAFTGYAIASFIYALLLGYFTPAIFSYNFFYGYFPGLSYDELLSLGWPLVIFRGCTIAVAFVLVWWADIIAQRTTPDSGTARKGVTLLKALSTRSLPVTILLALCFAVLYYFRCPLGWESSRSFVQRTLGGSVETKNFTIYYDSTSTTPEDLRFLVLEHEFRLHQVLDAFALPHTAHVFSYVYPSTAVKRRLVGAGETEIAKPWSSEVHITRSNVEDVLKHELVHVVAAPFGVPVLKASFSPGLTEGIAVAVEGVWGYRTLEQYAAAIRSADIAPSIRDIMAPTGFLTGSSAVSYELAGAFCRYLVDRYGMRPLVQVYGSGDYEKAYQVPLDTLIAGWQRRLDSVAVAESDRASVDVLFRRPAIFGKVCARVHARRLRDARRLLQERRNDEAQARYSQLYAEGGSYEALSGLLTAHFRGGEYPAVTRLYDSVTASDPVPRRYLPLAVLAGDALWASGNTARAESLYACVQKACISPAMTEAAFIRLWALSDSAIVGRFSRYFTAEMSDTARVVWLGAPANAVPDGIRQYLRGRLLLRMRAYGGAAYTLQEAGCIARDSTIEAMRQIAIADALWRAGRIQDARAWYWTSLNFDARPYAREVINDRLARCDWLAGVQDRMRNQ